MSKFKVGTLVMVLEVCEAARLLGLRDGHIGVVVAPPSVTEARVTSGNICVDFPGTTPPVCGIWQCFPYNLDPISGPDIDVEDNAERSYSDGLRVGEKA